MPKIDGTIHLVYRYERLPDEFYVKALVSIGYRPYRVLDRIIWCRTVYRDSLLVSGQTEKTPDWEATRKKIAGTEDAVRLRITSQIYPFLTHSLLLLDGDDDLGLTPPLREMKGP